MHESSSSNLEAGRAHAQRLTLAIYVLLAAVTSLPAFAKYTDRPLTVTLIYAALIAACLAGRRWYMSKLDESRSTAIAVWVMLCLMLLISNAALYPRTRMPAARSSAPDAMIEPARRMANGVHPYSDVVYGGAPISPTPGWLLAHAPLTVPGWVWSIVPVHLAVAALIISRNRSSSGSAFVLLILGLPAFLQMSFVGHDLFAVGCAMASTTLGLYYAARNSSRWLPLWALAAGVVATARVPLAIYPVVLTFLLARNAPRRAMVFFAIAGGIVVVSHSVFFLWGASLGLPYQPLHVFGRAGRAGSFVVPIGLALSASVALLQSRRGIDSPAAWLRLVWAVAGLPFAVVGFGELAGPTGWDWSNWEGKVYAGFGLPVLAAAIVSAEASTNSIPHRPA